MDTLINRLDSRDTDFTARLDRLLSWEGVSDDEVQHRVTDILARVKQEGDAALVEFSNRFDRLNVSSMAELVIGAERLAQAYADLPADQREALAVAAERVRVYRSGERRVGEECRSRWAAVH